MKAAAAQLDVMRSRMHRLAIWLSGLALLACSESPDRPAAAAATAKDSIRDVVEAHATTDTLWLDSAEARLGGIALGDSREQVRRQLGTADSADAARWDEFLDDSVSVWRYAGRRITFYGEMVAEVWCDSPRCATPAHVAPGDAESRLLETYGDSRQYGLTMAVRRYRVRGGDLQIEFTVFNGVIADVKLEYVAI